MWSSAGEGEVTVTHMVIYDASTTEPYDEDDDHIECCEICSEAEENQ